MKQFVHLNGREFVVEAKGQRDGKAVYLVDGSEVLMESMGDGTLCARAGELAVRVESQPAPASAHAAGKLRFLANQRPVEALVESERDRLRAATRPRETRGGKVTLTSTLPGIIRRVLRKPGDRVEAGDSVLTLEAMKMENEVRAELGGRLIAVHVRAGQVVQAGEALAEMEGE